MAKAGSIGHFRALINKALGAKHYVHLERASSSLLLQ